MNQPELSQIPHRRKNILTGEWVLVSPHRTNRPWQGEISLSANEKRKPYVPDCYLCPGNKRANGAINPQYAGTFVFTNDFSALLEDVPSGKSIKNNLLFMKSERGICRVVNFSPRHDLTLAEMQEGEIEEVITAWQNEFSSLGSHPRINYVQIFENKGSLMGNSNPHPHGQIWAQESIPMEPMKELKQFKSYYTKKKGSLLSDYLKLELKVKERIVYENGSFVVLVPFWAIWPYETIIISKRRISNILQLKNTEKKNFANALSVLTIKYDNLFKTSFPYSAGLHQAPTDGKDHAEWHFHMHFYPPLLRSASIKKFMVGYEMLAEPQRDITPEYSAGILKELSSIRY
ncbi:MAG: UDP-glucose--hexose-1-phosphate uridylyltransferase [Ignavibacteriales bacterium]|nr:UDP-glucose--hexose-1-phosphate uridylyltransferase [Ignavibacteriales bacterium]